MTPVQGMDAYWCWVAGRVIPGWNFRRMPAHMNAPLACPACGNPIERILKRVGAADLAGGFACEAV